MPITTLTDVQARCLKPGVEDERDILARSDTGSGKTLSFLMVGIERIVRNGGPDASKTFPVVILTPITDLANQIAQVSRKFLEYHPPMRTDVVIGGTNENADKRRLSTDRIDVLVATPGRLKSILKQSDVVRDRLSRCQTFVIDEVDKMTDPGFLRDTQYIHGIAARGNPKLQTLAYSATMDDRALLRLGLLKENAEFIDIPKNDKHAESVANIIIVTPVASSLDAVVGIVEEQQTSSLQRGGGIPPTLSDGTQRALSEWQTPQMDGYRIMIFLPSNAFIEYFSKAFSKALPSVKSFSIHGNLHQSHRTRVSDAFRSTDNCVLITSDASARGVDYPDITCVIQMGFDSREEFIQRSGRTGRAGKSGKSYVIACPEEAVGMKKICDRIDTLYVDSRISPQSDSLCDGITVLSYHAGGIVYSPDIDKKMAKDGYKGWLGSLASKWKRVGMTPEGAMNMARSLSDAMRVTPMDDKKLKDKLHIK